MNVATMAALDTIEMDEYLIAEAVRYGDIDLARSHATHLAQTRDGMLTTAELLACFSSRPGAVATPVTVSGPGREEPADIVHAPSPACAVSAEPETK